MTENDETAATLAEARAAIAAGRPLDAPALERRIREAGLTADRTDAALAQLTRLAAVHRARTLLEREPQTPESQPPEAQAPPAPAPPARLPGRSLAAALKARPTITGNMAVRKDGGADDPSLAWDPMPAVAGWEVRISERPDPRGEYELRETRELPAGATGVELTLGEHPTRIHVVGRRRDGRPVQHTLISVTRETWRDRWERKATAS